MAAWNPGQYLRFAAERSRPALDLLARVDGAEPWSGAALFDLGCGTGAATRMLKARWPEARVTGVDSSPEMLATAKAEGGDLAWVEADLATWRPDRPADLVFSNAALHWLENHDRLFPSLIDGLKAGGVLAVQMPRNHAEPSHRLMAETADAGPWRRRFAALSRQAPTHGPETYYDLLASRVRRLDLWETVYLHVL